MKKSNSTVTFTFNLYFGIFLVPDLATSGNDPLAEAPEFEEEEITELEVEMSDNGLPHLYILRGETPGDRWVLFQELCSALRIKTRDALLKQLGQNHKNDFRDLKTSEFFDQAKCCSILSTGDSLVNPRSHKVILVKYTDKLKALLNIEKVVIPMR